MLAGLIATSTGAAGADGARAKSLGPKPESSFAGATTNAAIVKTVIATAPRAKAHAVLPVDTGSSSWLLMGTLRCSGLHATHRRYCRYLPQQERDEPGESGRKGASTPMKRTGRGHGRI
jgi:hypothetical protein